MQAINHVERFLEKGPVMDEELLSEILVVEREIAEQIARAESESAALLESLAGELAALEEKERGVLREESERLIRDYEQAVRRDAALLMEAAEGYARRIGDIGNDELELILAPYLRRLRPEVWHDRQDEQA